MIKIDKMIDITLNSVYKNCFFKSSLQVLKIILHVTKIWYTTLSPWNVENVLWKITSCESGGDLKKKKCF